MYQVKLNLYIAYASHAGISIMRVYLVIWLYIAFTTAATCVNANPTLSVDTPFVVQGGNVNFTVTGEPGAAYVLLLRRHPARYRLVIPARCT